MTDEEDLDHRPPCEDCEGTGKDEDEGIDPVDGTINDCYSCGGSGLGHSERYNRWAEWRDWNFGRI